MDSEPHGWGTWRELVLCFANAASAAEVRDSLDMIAQVQLPESLCSDACERCLLEVGRAKVRCVVLCG